MTAAGCKRMVERGLNGKINAHVSVPAASENVRQPSLPGACSRRPNGTHDAGASMLAARAEQPIEYPRRLPHGGFVGELEPVDVVIHVRAEGSDMAHSDLLLCAGADRLAVLDDRTFGEKIGAALAYQIVGPVEGQRALGLDLHQPKVAHADRRDQDVAVGLFRELYEDPERERDRSL